MNNDITSVQNVNNNKSFLSESEAENIVKQHMQDNGLPCNDSIKFNTYKRQRYSADENHNKRDEYYYATLEEGTYVWVGYGTFSASKSDKSWITFYQLADGVILTREIKRKIDNDAEKSRKDNEACRIQRGKEEEEKFNLLKEELSGSGFYGYLEKKGVKNYGCRFWEEVIKENGVLVKKYDLIVPAFNIDGMLTAVQRITLENKDKLISKDCRINGCFFILNNEKIQSGDTIYIAEGYATAASVYEAVHACNVRVVLAFFAFNMFPVTKELLGRYKEIHIVIAADNDDAGLNEAKKCCREFGVSMAIPDIKEEDKKDFNDLHAQKGLKAVQECLSNETVLETDDDKAYKIAEKILTVDNANKGFDLDSMPKILRDCTMEICSSSAAQPLLVFSALLAVASAVINKNYCIEKGEHAFRKIYPNLWIIGVAGSGEFKSTAVEEATAVLIDKQTNIIQETRELKGKLEEAKRRKDEEVIDECAREISDLSNSSLLFPEKCTYEALIHLLGQGRKGLMVQDEFGAFIQEIVQTKGASQLGFLTKIYDVPRILEKVTKVSGNDCLEHPYVSILGITTDEWLKKGFKEEDVAGGFYPRFLMFKFPKSKVRPPSLPCMKIRSITTEARDAFESTIDEQIITEKSFTLSPEAEICYNSIFNQIYDEIEGSDNGKKELLLKFLPRWGVDILKVSMLFQHFENPKQIEIDKPIIEKAYIYVRCAMLSTLQILNSNLLFTPFQQRCDDVLKFIAQMTKENFKKAKTDKTQELSVSRRDVARRFKLTKKDLDEVLQHLEERGDIAIKERKQRGGSTAGIRLTDI
jgi:phage/plasmid primase-like uncharacterized protein